MAKKICKIKERVLNMSAKGNRKRQRYAFSLANITDERLNLLSEELEMSRSEIVDRAIKAYFQLMVKRGKIDSKFL